MKSQFQKPGSNSFSGQHSCFAWNIWILALRTFPSINLMGCRSNKVMRWLLIRWSCVRALPQDIVYVVHCWLIKPNKLNLLSGCQPINLMAPNFKKKYVALLAIGTGDSSNIILNCNLLRLAVYMVKLCHENMLMLRYDFPQKNCTSSRKEN